MRCLVQPSPHVICLLTLVTDFKIFRKYTVQFCYNCSILYILKLSSTTKCGDPVLIHDLDCVIFNRNLQVGPSIGWQYLSTRKSSCVNARGTPRIHSKCLPFWGGGGVPGDGVPPHPRLGYPPRDGVPPHPRLGYPPCPRLGYPPCPRLGYPPVQGWGTPPVQGWGTPHPRLGYPPSKAGSGTPPVDRHRQVSKTLPSRRTTYAGGNNTAFLTFVII